MVRPLSERRSRPALIPACCRVAHVRSVSALAASGYEGLCSASLILHQFSCIIGLRHLAGPALSGIGRHECKSAQKDSQIGCEVVVRCHALFHPTTLRCYVQDHVSRSGQGPAGRRPQHGRTQRSSVGLPLRLLRKLASN